MKKLLLFAFSLASLSTWEAQGLRVTQAEKDKVFREGNLHALEQNRDLPGLQALESRLRGIGAKRYAQMVQLAINRVAQSAAQAGRRAAARPAVAPVAVQAAPPALPAAPVGPPAPRPQGPVVQPPAPPVVPEAAEEESDYDRILNILQKIVAESGELHRHTGHFVSQTGAKVEVPYEISKEKVKKLKHDLRKMTKDDLYLVRQVAEDHRDAYPKGSSGWKAWNDILFLETVKAYEDEGVEEAEKEDDEKQPGLTSEETVTQQPEEDLKRKKDFDTRKRGDFEQPARDKQGSYLGLGGRRTRREPEKTVPEVQSQNRAAKLGYEREALDLEKEISTTFKGSTPLQAQQIQKIARLIKGYDIQVVKILLAKFDAKPRRTGIHWDAENTVTNLLRKEVKKRQQKKDAK